MAWVEKDHNDHVVSTPCYVQGHQPPDPAAQSHIQRGLECLQGWGIHSLLGQPVPVCHHFCVKNFFLISNLNLPCLSLKPFPLVLSLSTLMNSHLSWGPGQPAAYNPTLGRCWTRRSPEMSSNISSPVTVWKTGPQCLYVIIYHILNYITQLMSI